MGRPDSRIASCAADALLIRRAVAPLLLHGELQAGAWARAAAVGDEAWRLFLRVERCALPLRRALSRVPSAAPADAPFRALLAAVAQREAARVVIARSHLRTAAAVAAAHGFQVVVLKGGALTLGDDPVDLSDIDLLVPRDQTPGFTAALQDQHWTATNATTERVAQSLLAHDLRIELHHSLGVDDRDIDEGVWRRVEPLASLSPLLQLGPSDNLLHIVHHVAIDHPNRRGRLRDLVLIARAAARCDATEVASAYADRSSYPVVLSRATLDAATSNPHGEARARDERPVVTTYVLAQRPRLRMLPREVREFIDMWSVSMLLTAWERRQVWASALVASPEPSTRAVIRWIEHRSPTLGRAWRVSARTAYRAATWLAAWPIATRARRVVEQVLRSSVLQES